MDQYFQRKARAACETLLAQAKALAKRYALDEALDSVRRFRLYSNWLQDPVPESVQKLELSLRQRKIAWQLQTTLRDSEQSDFQLVSLVQGWTWLAEQAKDSDSAVDFSQLIALGVPIELLRSMDDGRIQERPRFISVGLAFIGRILSSAVDPKRVFSDTHAALKALLTVLRSCSEPNAKTIALELLRALLTTKDVTHIAIHQHNLPPRLLEAKQAFLPQTDTMRALVLLFRSLVQLFPMHRSMFESSGVYICSIAILGRYYKPPGVHVALPCLGLLLWVCQNGHTQDLRASETGLCATLVAALRSVCNAHDQDVSTVKLTAYLIQLIQALTTGDEKARRSLEAQKAASLVAKAHQIYGDSVAPICEPGALVEPALAPEAAEYRARGTDSFGFAAVGPNNKKTFCLARVLTSAARISSNDVECRLRVARFERKGLSLSVYRFRGPAPASAVFLRKLTQLKGTERTTMLKQAWEAFTPISG